MAISSQKNKALKIIKIAKKVIDDEKKTINDLKKTIDNNFVKAIDILLSQKKIILTGLGKSGIIAKKISSTLASIGIESVYIHPVEAMHGDMGIISKGDVIIALSNSGNTNETNKFILLAKKRNARIIGITSNSNSKLSQISDITLNIKVTKEACPYNLIPTSSTTAMLVLGDAIAITILSLKGYQREDFAKNHPGGNIGRLLYVKVSEIMRKGKLCPKVFKDQTVRDAIDIMTSTSLGATTIIDKKGKLIGYFTDGDLRRKFENIKLDEKIEKYMTPKPLSIHQDELAINAAKIINEKKVDNLPVVNKDGKVVGIIDEKDLIREGII
jgi:arabinose-5-phosphate isomerase